MGPLEALYNLYGRVRSQTLKLDRLGKKDAKRGVIDLSKLPEQEIGDISSKTKEPFLLGVEYLNDDGVVCCHALKSPCGSKVAKQTVHNLVKSGVHPLDIVVLKWSYKEESFVSKRTSVDFLYWTHKDQYELEKYEGEVI